MNRCEVLVEDLVFPEGPAFDPQGGLWGVELLGGTLFTWVDGGITRVPVGGEPNGAAFFCDTLFFCDAAGHAIRSYRPSTGVLGTVVASHGEVVLDRPNDLAFDRCGNLVFTCPGNSRSDPTGTVWCLSASGHLTCVARDLYFPNGLAFSPDGRELVVAETYRHRLWRGRWNEMACRWEAAGPWAQIGGPTGPDGMAFARDGQLYVAAFGLGVIKQVRVNGSVAREIQVPGARPTNVAFDPSGRLGLVVTEAEHGRLLSLTDLKDDSCLFTGGAGVSH